MLSYKSQPLAFQRVQLKSLIRDPSPQRVSWNLNFSLVATDAMTYTWLAQHWLTHVSLGCPYSNIANPWGTVASGFCGRAKSKLLFLTVDPSEQRCGRRLVSRWKLPKASTTRTANSKKKSITATWKAEDIPTVIIGNRITWYEVVHRRGLTI